MAPYKPHPEEKEDHELMTYHDMMQHIDYCRKGRLSLLFKIIALFLAFAGGIIGWALTQNNANVRQDAVIEALKETDMKAKMDLDEHDARINASLQEMRVDIKTLLRQSNKIISDNSMSSRY